jgi:hypothetical protein
LVVIVIVAFGDPLTLDDLRTLAHHVTHSVAHILSGVRAGALHDPLDNPWWGRGIDRLLPHVPCHRPNGHQPSEDENPHAHHAFIP